MHKPSPAPHLVDALTACPCTSTIYVTLVAEFNIPERLERAARPEYAVVALHDDLLKLAHDMHERADELGLLHPDGMLLRVYAGNTVVSADLVASGTWSIDTGRAWLDAGRASIERTRA